jgi:hypothetical protein
MGLSIFSPINMAKYDYFHFVSVLCFLCELSPPSGEAGDVSFFFPPVA